MPKPEILSELDKYRIIESVKKTINLYPISTNELIYVIRNIGKLYQLGVTMEHILKGENNGKN